LISTSSKAKKDAGNGRSFRKTGKFISFRAISFSQVSPAFLAVQQPVLPSVVDMVPLI
jgi:hypothetical protein